MKTKILWSSIIVLLFAGIFAQAQSDDKRKDSTMTGLEEARKTTRPDTVKVLILSHKEVWKYETYSEVTIDSVTKKQVLRGYTKGVDIAADKKLKKLPKDIKRFKNLEEIRVDKNAIQTVPRWLTRLHHLKIINLAGNPVRKMVFRKNKSLEVINLMNCELTQIPEKLYKNTHLKDLILANNKIKTVSGNIRKIKNLEVLNLYHNEIVTISPDLINLSKLSQIDLYYNKLEYFPSVFLQMPWLKTLALSFNNIGTLPDDIDKMTNLTELYLRNNSMSQLPDKLGKLQNLKFLFLSGNRFKAFPACILALPNLEELDMSENRLTVFPKEVLEIKTLKWFNLRNNTIAISDHSAYYKSLREFKNRNINLLADVEVE
jgi:Leucine-rich repeat (LRR) protein